MIGALKNNDSNTHGGYIFWWTGNEYTIQEKYICYAFDTQVIITEGELVCPAKFMKSTRKTYYWYHEPYEAIPVMVKLKQVVMP